jgi:hypothetical protein
LLSWPRGDAVPPLPNNAPQAGERYRHYKGDVYKVVLLAEHSNDEEWMVVYEADYENPDAPYFTLPLREWLKIIEKDGQSLPRFLKI